MFNPQLTNDSLNTKSESNRQRSAQLGHRMLRSATGLFLLLLMMVAMAGSAAALDLPNDDAVISTGFAHSCGLKADGSVDCWGLNDDGQAIDQTGPFTQISAGGYHTCGLKTDGSVDCWGANNDGQADDQTGPFTQVSAGTYHTCGLKTDGSVDCWGANNDGQADDQTGPFTQVSAGGNHTCGLKSDGNVDCWGYRGGQDGPFTQISAENNYTCGLKADGNVACWSSGQADDIVGSFIQVSAGTRHTCGLRIDGSVDCWGNNQFGETADQDGIFTQVSAGGYHNCALKTDGSVTCWGLNGDGQAEDQAGPFAPYDENSTPDDTTAPVITPTVMGNRNNGWYFGDVEVSWSVTDDESTITSTSGCDTILIDSDTAGLTLTCEATSEGGTASESVTIQRDATPPTTTASVSPAANANGWHNSDVTVSFSGSDETSGIAGCSEPIILSDEGANQAPGGSCSDNAGNVSTASVSVNIDKTAPTAVNDAYSTDQDTPLTIAAPGVLSNDSDAGSGLLAATINEEPRSGGLTLNADGSFTYTPGAGFTGTDTFLYAVSDSADNSAIGTVKITVNATVTPFATCGGYAVFETAPGIYTAPDFPGTLIVGTDGYDWLQGTAGPDLILGLQGGDDLWGGDGDDVICGGAGVDIILGQRGNDTLYGDDQPDWLIGGPDNDTLYGGAGWDDLEGQGGQDTLHGEGGLDVLLGGADNDLLLGGDDPDALFGQNGDDALDGGLADDYCRGGRGADTITNCEGASSAGATADQALDVDEEAARRSNDGTDGENAIEQRIQQVFLPLVSNE